MRSSRIDERSNNLRLYPARAGCKRYGRTPAAAAQLLTDRADVGVDRARAAPGLGSDLFGARPGCQQMENLALGRRKRCIAALGVVRKRHRRKQAGDTAEVLGPQPF